MRTSTAFAAILAFAAAPALAQVASTDEPTRSVDVAEEAQAQAMEATDIEAGTFSDETLEAFADAVEAVDGLRTDYRGQIDAAATQADRDRLTDEANREIARTVRDTDGITIEEYNAIATQAQTDSALNARVDLFLEEAAEDDSAG